MRMMMDGVARLHLSGKVEWKDTVTWLNSEELIDRLILNFWPTFPSISN